MSFETLSGSEDPIWFDKLKMEDKQRHELAIILLGDAESKNSIVLYVFLIFSHDKF